MTVVACDCAFRTAMSLPCRRMSLPCVPEPACTSLQRSRWRRAGRNHIIYAATGSTRRPVSVVTPRCCTFSVPASVCCNPPTRHSGVGGVDTRVSTSLGVDTPDEHHNGAGRSLPGCRGRRGWCSRDRRRSTTRDHRRPSTSFTDKSPQERSTRRSQPDCCGATCEAYICVTLSFISASSYKSLLIMWPSYLRAVQWINVLKKVARKRFIFRSSSINNLKQNQLKQNHLKQNHFYSMQIFFCN